MKTTLITFLATFMLGNHTFAQNRVSAHLGFGVPLGEFADGVDYSGNVRNESFAGTGLSLNLAYQYQLGTTGLHLFGDVGAHRNAVRLRYRRDYKNTLGDDDKINHSEYYNVPLTVGALYQWNLDDQIAVFIKGGFLLNFFKISKTRTEETQGSITLIRERRYTSERAIGGSGEVGVILQDKYSIGLGVTRFGSFYFQEESSFLYVGEEEFISFSNRTKNVTMFNLKVGYRF